MSNLPLRVVKLGGSLLDLPELRERLRAWLKLQPSAGTVLVVGGGAMADAIRAADRLHGLSNEAAHWLCIRAMSLNTRLVAELLPEAVLATNLAEARQAACPEGRLSIIDPWPFLREEDPRVSAVPLPCSWDVTSDSIAARLATLLPAAELVLLKSLLLDGATNCEAAARAGHVDAYFPRTAADLKLVRCVDLRSERFPSERLQ